MALVASAAIVSACSTQGEKSVIQTVTVSPEVSAEAKKPCDPPVILPDRPLTDTEAGSLWGRDRTALRVCETRRAAGVASIAGGQP